MNSIMNFSFPENKVAIGPVLYRTRIWHGDFFNDFTDELSGRYSRLIAKERIGKVVKRIRPGINGVRKA